MTYPMIRQTRRVTIAGAALVGLCLSSGAFADNDDLITTASTAGTTAYIVGKNVDDDDFAQAHDFADTQAVALKREAATGGGENIDSLAALLGEDDASDLGAWMQANYAELYGRDAGARNPVDRIVAAR